MGKGILRLPDEAALERLLDRMHKRASGQLHIHRMESKQTSDSCAPQAKPRGRYEAELLWQLKLAGHTQLVSEYRFDESRKWAFDIADPLRKRAIEVEGPAHAIKARFKSDLEKYRAAELAGWRLLRVTTKEVKSCEALNLCETFLTA